MVGSLIALGVPAEKIGVVFNRVKKEVKSAFPIISAYQQQASALTFSPECAVF